MKGAYPDPLELAKELSKRGFIDNSSNSDYSAKILMYIALALESLEQLKTLDQEPKIGNRPTVGPALNKAWVEAIQYRLNLPADYFKRIEQPNIRLTRFGNIE